MAIGVDAPAGALGERSPAQPGSPVTGRRRPQTRSRAAARAVRIAAIAVSTSSAKAATSRKIVGSEATVPKTSSCARTTATSASSRHRVRPRSRHRATTCPGHGRPGSTATATTPTTATGPAQAARSCDATALRRRRKPATRAQDREPTSGHGLRFTYGVPFRLEAHDFSNHESSELDRHFRALRAVLNPQDVKARG